MVDPISAMDLEEKVGQLFVAGFQGAEPSPAIVELLEERHLGGVIYFTRNVESRSQLVDLSATLREHAAVGSDHPLLLTVDQEEGVVSRLDWQPRLPGAMAVGATGDQSLARDWGEAIGRKLRSVGITMNLAPVLDVTEDGESSVVGVRSLGDDPELVADLGVAATKGHQDANVAACGKHFPGHGATSEDSHHTLSVVTDTQDEIEETAIVPFEATIDAGIDAVMTCHVAFPELGTEKDQPATLSRSVMTEYLRGDLGHDGVVVTDCLEMSAITETVGTAEGAVQAFEAGSDLLLVCHTPERQHEAIDAMIDAVASGRIAESRLDESVRRILEMKYTTSDGLLSSSDSAAEGKARDGGSSADQESVDLEEIPEKIARSSVTLLHDKEQRLPIESETVPIVVFSDTTHSPAEDDPSYVDDLTDAFASTGIEPTLHSIPADSNPSAELTDTTPIVCTYDAVNHPAQATFIQSLVENGVEPIVIALKNPYDIETLPSISTYISTYDYTPASLRVAAETVVGTTSSDGTMPVSLAGVQ